MSETDEADEIAAFYAARLGEDEALARDSLCINCRNPTLALRSALGVTGYTHGREDADPEHPGSVWQGVRCPGRITGAQPVQDPPRVLREVEAGRKLLREYGRLLERKASHESHRRALPHRTPFNAPGWPSEYGLLREGHFLEQALPLVHGLVVANAAAYSDHPDHKIRWAAEAFSPRFPVPPSP